MSAFELIAYALVCFVLALGGGLAGLVLGNLRLPLSVSFASTAAAGAGANVAISGIAAAAASVTHVRAGRIDWQMFYWLLPPSIVGALIGGLLAGEVPEEFLLVSIATVLIFTAGQLLRWKEPDAEPQRDRAIAAGAADGAKVDSEVVAKTPAGASTIGDATTTHTGRLVAIGFVVGLLGGFVGLILGSLRVPALLKFADSAPQKIVGTSLLIGVAVGLFGWLGHFISSTVVDLDLLAAGAVGSVPGAVLGAQLTGKLETHQLVRLIGAIVLIAAIGMYVRAFT